MAQFSKFKLLHVFALKKIQWGSIFIMKFQNLVISKSWKKVSIQMEWLRKLAAEMVYVVLRKIGKGNE